MSDATEVKRYQVYIPSLTEIDMAAAFPLNYTSVMLAIDYDSLAAQLREAWEAIRSLRIERDALRKVLDKEGIYHE